MCVNFLWGHVWNKLKYLLTNYYVCTVLYESGTEKQRSNKPRKAMIQTGYCPFTGQLCSITECRLTRESCWPQMGPMLSPWTLLSGANCHRTAFVDQSMGIRSTGHKVIYHQAEWGHKEPSVCRAFIGTIDPFRDLQRMPFLWSNHKQRLMTHIPQSVIRIIRCSTNNFGIIRWKMGKLKTYSPKCSITDDDENYFHLALNFSVRSCLFHKAWTNQCILMILLK